MNFNQVIRNLVRNTKHNASKRGYKHIQGKGKYPKGAGTTLTQHQRVLQGRNHE